MLRGMKHGLLLTTLLAAPADLFTDHVPHPWTVRRAVCHRGSVFCLPGHPRTRPSSLVQPPTYWPHNQQSRRAQTFDEVLGADAGQEDLCLPG